MGKIDSNRGARSNDASDILLVSQGDRKIATVMEWFH